MMKYILLSIVCIIIFLIGNACLGKVIIKESGRKLGLSGQVTKFAGVN